MLWMTLILALLISFAALAFVLWPLLNRHAPVLPIEDDRLTELVARKDNTLRALKDLEFDHQVGKLSEEDYARFYERLSRQAVALMGQLEKITPQITGLDDVLEAEIAKGRRTLPGRNGATKPSVATPAKSPEARATADVQFCTECGARLQPGFKFCASCGAPVAQLTSMVDQVS